MWLNIVVCSCRKVFICFSFEKILKIKNDTIKRILRLVKVRGKSYVIFLPTNNSFLSFCFNIYDHKASSIFFLLVAKQKYKKKRYINIRKDQSKKGFSHTYTIFFYINNSIPLIK